MKGLIIKPYWADLILNREKTWEIRGSATKIRGKIAIIKSGTGNVWGTAELVDCHPVYRDDLRFTRDKHRIQSDAIVTYEKPFAWVLQNAKKYPVPIPYNHPQGAVIWVNLDL